jgi:urease accessory protein
MTTARILSARARWSTMRTLTGSILGITATQPAWPHHPMGGMTPGTPLDGLLSGLAHPVIGVDHLMFLIGAGVLMGLVISPVRTLAVLSLIFVLTAAAGTLLHAGGLSLGGVDIAIAVSLLVVGVGLWRQRLAAIPVLGALALLGGSAHGYAFGEAVIGAEPTPLVAYLIGLATVQFALLIAAFTGARYALGHASTPFLRRAAQALSAGVTALGGWALAVRVWS